MSVTEVAFLAGVLVGTLGGMMIMALSAARREGDDTARMWLMGFEAATDAAIGRAMREDADTWEQAAAELGMDREGRMTNHRRGEWRSEAQG